MTVVKPPFYPPDPPSWSDPDAAGRPVPRPPVSCLQCGATNIGIQAACLLCQAPLPPWSSRDARAAPAGSGVAAPASSSAAGAGAAPTARPFCTHCGNRLGPGLRFCTTCGSRVG